MLNLMVYGIMGMVKAATPTKTIQQLVDRMQTGEAELGDQFIEPEAKLESPNINVKNLHEISDVKMKKKSEQHISQPNNSRVVFKSQQEKEIAEN